MRRKGVGEGVQIGEATKIQQLGIKMKFSA
jgi:hypothetical protein